jgi:hypothetical protein
VAPVTLGRFSGNRVGLVRQHAYVTEHREESKGECEPPEHGTSPEQSFHRRGAYTPPRSSVNGTAVGRCLSDGRRGRSPPAASGRARGERDGVRWLGGRLGALYPVIALAFVVFGTSIAFAVKGDAWR